jgi:hypothetical protein
MTTTLSRTDDTGTFSYTTEVVMPSRTFDLFDAVFDDAFTGALNVAFEKAFRKTFEKRLRASSKGKAPIRRPLTEGQLQAVDACINDPRNQ